MRMKQRFPVTVMVLKAWSTIDREEMAEDVALAPPTRHSDWLASPSRGALPPFCFVRHWCSTWPCSWQCEHVFSLKQSSSRWPTLLQLEHVKLALYAEGGRDKEREGALTNETLLGRAEVEYSRGRLGSRHSRKPWPGLSQLKQLLELEPLFELLLLLRSPRPPREEPLGLDFLFGL